MKFYPLFDYVLVRRDPVATRAGALILAGAVSALEARSRAGNPGTVVAVGPGGWRERVENGKRVVKRREMTLREGDRVLCGFRVDNDITRHMADGHEYCVMREENIQGRIIE